jgi:hypothetical protein
MRPVPREVLVERLVEQLYQTYLALWDAQQTTMIELGQTELNRFALSCTMAETLYKSGIQNFSLADLHQLVSEGELQAMLYLLICGYGKEVLVHDWSTRLLLQHRHHEEPVVGAQFKREYYGTFIDSGSGDPGEPGTGEDGAVSPVPPRARAHRRGVQQSRTARTPGRTGRRD